MYSTDIGLVVVLISVSLIPSVPKPGALAIPNCKILIQENVIPGELLVGLYVKVSPEQISGSDVGLVNTGGANTVIG